MSYYLGVDIGSAFSKAVVLKESELLFFEIIPSGGNYSLASDNVVNGVLEKAGLTREDISGAVATGYGSSSVSLPNRQVTDITCIGRGAFHLFPSVRTVVDIGGQYSRVIKLDGAGRNTSFLMSEKCAGGSGRFLQTIAHVLGIEFDEMGPLSMKSVNAVDFTTGCAVFAESEVISRVAEGAAVEDILAGAHNALAARIQSLIERLGMEKDITLCGGGAKDTGLTASISEALQTEPLVPEEPQIVAALGAALVARDTGGNQ